VILESLQRSISSETIRFAAAKRALATKFLGRLPCAKADVAAKDTFSSKRRHNGAVLEGSSSRFY
jgi:hypothetical protein